MRSVLVGAAVFALAACSGEAEETPAAEPVEGGTKSPDAKADARTENSADADTSDAKEESAPIITLEGGGLTAGSEKLLFNAGRAETDATLTAVLGDPTGTNSNDECGAGAMDFTDYPGGLTMNYMEGQLVGWYWRGPLDGDPDAKVSIAATGGVKLGTPKATVEAVRGYSIDPESTLGEEFSISGSFAGFFEEGAVSSLYGGDQCFFR